MAKGFTLRCAAGKTARVLMQGKCGVLMPGVALVLFPPREGETEDSVIGYRFDKTDYERELVMLRVYHGAQPWRSSIASDAEIVSAITDDLQ